MTPELYLVESEKTERKFPDGLHLNTQQAEILHHALGLATEAAEILDMLKKHLIYGKPLDLVNLGEELGDCAWYEAGLLRILKKTRSEIERVNIAKLAKRYPDKFSATAALHRDLTGERQLLEGGFATSGQSAAPVLTHL